MAPRRKLRRSPGWWCFGSLWRRRRTKRERRLPVGVSHQRPRMPSGFAAGIARDPPPTCRRICQLIRPETPKAVSARSFLTSGRAAVAPTIVSAPELVWASSTSTDAEGPDLRGRQPPALHELVLRIPAAVRGRSRGPAGRDRGRVVRIDAERSHHRVRPIRRAGWVESRHSYRAATRSSGESVGTDPLWGSY